MADRWSMQGRAIVVLGLTVAASACGFSSPMSGATGAAGRGTGPTGAAGRAGPMGAGAGVGTSGGGGSGESSGSGGAGGLTACVPGVVGPIIVDCGYPYGSSPALASVVFNENETLRAIDPSGTYPTGIIRVFYNDEHALTLGVRQVVVKTASGTTTTDYPVSPLLTDPGSVTSPQTGTNQLVGDESGLDASLRPMWPVLFITDTTTDRQSRAGDWQQGGRPRSPDAVFGSWKSAVRTVDKTVTPNLVSIAPDADPAKNNWDLAGGDAVPTGLKNEGFGAEARWTVTLIQGHTYRIQVMVHDGDQNKAGGDSGEACVDFCTGGGPSTETSGSGGQGGSGEPPPMCPSGYVSCGPGGVSPESCPAGTVCANGCCLVSVG